MGKGWNCPLDNCNGRMRLRSYYIRPNGDVIRLRRCLECGKELKTIELERNKFDKIRKFMQNIQVALHEYKECKQV